MPLLGFPLVLCVQGKLPGSGNTALDPLRLGVLTKNELKVRYYYLQITGSENLVSVIRLITHQLSKVDRMLIENGANYKMLVEELVLRCL